MSEVKILDGNTFVVSDDRGDIEASPTDPTGLFSFDTRFLSRWVLTVNGQRLNPLSVDDLQYFETRFEKFRCLFCHFERNVIFGQPEVQRGQANARTDVTILVEACLHLSQALCSRRFVR